MKGRDRSPSGPRAWTENERQGPISERSASMDCDYWESAWLRSLIIREIIYPAYDGPLGDRSLPFTPLIRRTARRPVPTFYTPHTTDCPEVDPYLAPLTRGESLDDLDQLDIEHKSAGRCAWRRILAVGKLAGDPEAAFLAFHHQLNPFGPTGNDLIQWENDRFVA